MIYAIFDNSNNGWAKASTDLMPTIVTYIHVHVFT